MKSFPSTLNSSMLQYGLPINANNMNFDISRLHAMNLNTSVPVIQELLKEQNINLGNYQQFTPMISLYDNKSKSTIEQENPNMLPYDVMALIKDYEWQYNEPAGTVVGYNINKQTPDLSKEYDMKVSVAPSMFNPMYGVNVLGMISNVPLLNGIDNGNYAYMSNVKNLSVCTIKELCTLSNSPNSILGMARYKYADFMYCKDLGKVSNNYLITLRRFAHPVPDHIFELSNPNYINAKNSVSFAQEGDVGRLVTWFGTDDNKLEDIIKFSYYSTWKELGADYEVQFSQADDPTGGILGKFSAVIDNPQYDEAIANGTAGNNNLWTYLAGKISPKGAGLMEQGIGKNNTLLTNYDNNKVYNPKNTIQRTHMYEGKIEFNHEFTLVFSYKLRAYDNINPKSAFLDLIGNILEVTGRRGRFWGGSRKLIGPAVNMPFYDKAENIIDNAFDKLGGVWETLQSNGFSIDTIMGILGDQVDTIKDTAMSSGQGFIDTLGSMHIKPIESAKGFVKNALGRPQKIAWQSLLDGSDTGLWHVTIGNPKNPIMVMGNLILVDSNIQQSGPLGVDDFPSNLKVSITLKHARPRDITDISKMYTKGMSALYMPLATRGYEHYFDSISSGGGSSINDSTFKNAFEHIKTPDSEAKQKGTEQNNENIKKQSAEVQNYMIQEAEYFQNKTGNNSVLINSEHSFKNAQLNNYSAIMAALAGNEVV